MKTVALLGSPRVNGNSTLLAEIIASAVERKGGSVTRFYLNQLEAKGCQACGACKGTSEVCVVKDDLAEVLETVKAAEVIIMASPVYWGDISAQLKIFIDRTYSYLTPGFMSAEIKHRLPEGKKLVFILSQGASQELYSDVFDRYNSFFKQLNYFTETYLLRGCELNEPGALGRREDLVNRAREIAAQL